MVPVTHLTPYEKLEKFTELLSLQRFFDTFFKSRGVYRRSNLKNYEIATLPSVAHNDITDRRDACPTIPLEVLHHK
jgi:hypothetical protein